MKIKPHIGIIGPVAPPYMEAFMHRDVIYPLLVEEVVIGDYLNALVEQPPKPFILHNFRKLPDIPDYVFKEDAKIEFNYQKHYKTCQKNRTKRRKRK